MYLAKQKIFIFIYFIQNGPNMARNQKSVFFYIFDIEFEKISYST
jgi:hypothetical protein